MITDTARRSPITVPRATLNELRRAFEANGQ